MESGNKPNILLVAAVFGVFGFIIWNVIFFTPIGHTHSIPAKPVYGFMIFFWVAPIPYFSPIVAIILNIIAWLKKDRKKTLIASILYIISLNIPSAVIGLVSFAKMRKSSKEADKNESMVMV